MTPMTLRAVLFEHSRDLESWRRVRQLAAEGEEEVVGIY